MKENREKAHVFPSVDDAIAAVGKLFLFSSFDHSAYFYLLEVNGDTVFWDEADAREERRGETND